MPLEAESGFEENPSRLLVVFITLYPVNQAQLWIYVWFKAFKRKRVLIPVVDAIDMIGPEASVCSKSFPNCFFVVHKAAD